MQRFVVTPLGNRLHVEVVQAELFVKSNFFRFGDQALFLRVWRTPQRTITTTCRLTQTLTRRKHRTIRTTFEKVPKTHDRQPKTMACPVNYRLPKGKTWQNRSTLPISQLPFPTTDYHEASTVRLPITVKNTKKASRIPITSVSRLVDYAP